MGKRRWAAVLCLVSALVSPLSATANDTGGAVRCVGGSTSLASAYNEAFGRPLGNWQAGDAPHSYPLPDGSMLWVLNDSFLNAKNPGGALTTDSVFVHNVAVKQVGGCFEVMAGMEEQPPLDPAMPTTTVDPTSPTTLPRPISFLSTGEVKNQTWWWFHGGDVEGEYLKIFVTAMRQAGAPGWSAEFQPGSVAIATYKWRTLELVDLRAAPNAGVHPAYGFSVASDDTWTYLYGQDDNLRFAFASRQNYVARVPKHRLDAVPTYWNGHAWIADPAAAVSVSTEGTWDHRMSVIHEDDRWIATAKEDDFFGDEFLILEAPVAQGPWVVTQRFPVPTLTNPGDAVTYEGMAIPRVIDGRIIVTWSNNQFDYARVAVQPRLYRPTFTDVTLGSPTQSNAICHGDQVGRSGQLQAGQTSRFSAVAPTRVLDTRNTGAPWAAGEIRTLDLADKLALTRGSFSAAVLTVAMVDTAGQGFVTVWPDGSPQPQASNVNADRAGSTSADLVTTAVDTNGLIRISSSIGAHLIVDVSGVYLPAASATEGRLVSVPPARLLDTRDAIGILPVRHDTTLTLLGRGGLPSQGVSAVVLNVTGSGARAAGFVTAWASGPRPTVSNLNLDKNSTRANQVIVPVAADGTMQLYNDASMHLLVDVAGYFTAADAPLSTTGLFVPVVPIRLLDSRQAPGRPGTGCVAQVTVPADARAAVTTVTLVDATKAGYATAWPDGQSQPGTSTLNVDGAGQTRPNHAIVGLDAHHNLQVFTEPRGHVIIDLSGYYV